MTILHFSWTYFCGVISTEVCHVVYLCQMISDSCAY